MPRGAHSIVLLGVSRATRADITVIQRAPPLEPPPRSHARHGIRGMQTSELTPTLTVRDWHRPRSPVEFYLIEGKVRETGPRPAGMRFPASHQ